MQEKIVFCIEKDKNVVQQLEGLFASINISVESYSHPDDFLNHYDDECAGCIISEMRMPGMSGLSLLQHCRGQGIMLPMIFISEQSDAKVIVKAMRAGALNFFTKPLDESAIIEGVNEAFARYDWCRDLLIKAKKFIELRNKLTKREKQVMESMIEGNMNKMTAEKLGIATKTVELHRAKVMEKIQVKSVAEIVDMYRDTELLNILKDEFHLL